jgi:hypothetical protein
VNTLTDEQTDRLIAAIKGWPAPAPGTHSSDYHDISRPCPCDYVDFQPPNGQTIHEHNEEYVNAARWSRGE